LIFIADSAKEYIFEVYTLNMKNLSLKLSDSVFEETEQVIKKIRKPRNRYINDALTFYNRYHKKKLLKELLQKESGLVTKSSKEILDELEKLEE
jgi:metal-responsive CopG/Arc/MetJ family transcriptional regulator